MRRPVGAGEARCVLVRRAALLAIVPRGARPTARFFPKALRVTELPRGAVFAGDERRRLHVAVVRALGALDDVEVLAELRADWGGAFVAVPGGDVGRHLTHESTGVCAARVLPLAAPVVTMHTAEWYADPTRLS